MAGLCIHDPATFDSWIHLECGNDLAEKFFVDCSRLIGACGIHISPDQVGTTVCLQVISDFLGPRREFPGLSVLIRLGSLIAKGRIRQARVSERWRDIGVIA